MRGEEQFDSQALQNLAFDWVELSKSYNFAACEKYSDLKNLSLMATTFEEKALVAEIIGKSFVKNYLFIITIINYYTD